MKGYNRHMSLERFGLEETRIQQSVELFKRVRNFPYRLGLDGDPDKLVTEGVGNCTRKHLYLLPKLKQLGRKTEIGVAVFDWRQLLIPEEIISLLKDPIQAHMFLFVDDKPVDATWPQDLPPGFPSNQWDGINATPLGVTALEIIKPNSLIFQTRLIASSTFNVLRNLLGKEKLTPFNDAFNQWMERLQGGKIDQAEGI